MRFFIEFFNVISKKNFLWNFELLMFNLVKTLIFEYYWHISFRFIYVSNCFLTCKFLYSEVNNFFLQVLLRLQKILQRLSGLIYGLIIIKLFTALVFFMFFLKLRRFMEFLFQKSKQYLILLFLVKRYKMLRNHLFQISYCFSHYSLFTFCKEPLSMSKFGISGVLLFLIKLIMIEFYCWCSFCLIWLFICLLVLVEIITTKWYFLLI